MYNLGLKYLGESVTLNRSVVNASGNLQNVSYIRFSVVDNADVIKFNTTNISNRSIGLYILDFYLDNSTFNEGSHYCVWDGNYRYNNRTYYFYYQDHLYIEDTKLE